MTPEAFKGQFSMPAGAPLYAQPPYVYRGVQDLFITYEAEADRVREWLPPHLELADSPALCMAWARWVPWSTFGPYHEAYIMVRVRFAGTTYLYQPVIVVDNEVPLGAGREIWGYAKKMATFTRGWGDTRGGFGEQLLFRVERPVGQPLMTASMVADRRASPDELGEDLPVLSCRIVPSPEAGAPPSVAELVRLDVSAHLHAGPDGNPELYAGRANLNLAGGAADPWHLLGPTRVVAGHFGVFDFDLGHGRVVHDYLQDPEVWGR
jgi:acetoacetate decarboxylase